MAKFKIPDFGYEEKDFETSNLSKVNEVLKDFGNEMQTELRASITEGGGFGDSNDSGNLSQSINFSTTTNGVTTTFKLILADYYDYVNKGTKGVFSSAKAPNSPYQHKVQPSAKHFDLWARKRGLNPFAVAKSIQQTGTNPNYFYDKVVTKDRLKQLSVDLAQASSTDAQVYITNLAKGVFGSVSKK